MTDYTLFFTLDRQLLLLLYLGAPGTVRGLFTLSGAYRELL